MKKLSVLIALFFVFVTVATASTVDSRPQPSISTFVTDTVQERRNVTETGVNNTTTGWHWETGADTYLFNVDNTWTTVTSRTDDGEMNDVEVTLQLSPNNLTRLLVANKEPWKSITNRTAYFNKHYYFHGRNITPTEFSTLEAELMDLPVYEWNGTDYIEEKSTSVKDQPKNVTVKVKLRGEQRETRIKIGRESTVTAVSGGNDDTYDKFKPVNVTTASGNPSIAKAQPVNLTCGDDTITGTGQIVVNCTNIDGVEDIDFANTTDHRLPYEIEFFNLDTGGDAVVWVWNDWTLDGTEQLRVHYGSGSTDEQDVSATWSNSGQNTFLTHHLEETPDADTGTNELDDSGPNGYDADTSGTSQVDGQLGDGLSFDGSDDEVTTTSGSGWAAGNTVIAWINPPDQGGSNTGVVAATDGSNNQIRFRISDFAQDMGVGYYTYDGSVYGVDDASANAISKNVWNHYVGAFDSTSGYEVYVDGSSVATSSDTTWVQPSSNVVFGSVDGSGYYEGDLDAVRVYDERKSSDWIQADYNASPSGGLTFFEQQAASGGNSAPNKPTLNSPSPNGTVISDASPTLNVTHTDPDGDSATVNFSFANNDTQFASVSSVADGGFATTSLSNLADGEIKWYATADDGSLTTDSDTFHFTVDTTPPTIAYNPSSTNAGTFSQSYIFVNVSATDTNLDTVTEEFDGTNSSFNTNMGDNWWENHTGLADGTYTVQAFANDTAGNDAATSERSITLDTIAPTITIHNPNNQTYTSSSVALDVTADETVDTWQYSLDGGSNTTFTPNTTLTGLSDGGHTVDVYANDTAGNTDHATESFTVDAKSPLWRNLQDNVSQFATKSNNVSISVEWASNGSGLDKVKFADNDSGGFENATKISPSYLSSGIIYDYSSFVDFDINGIDWNGTHWYAITNSNIYLISKQWESVIDSSNDLRDFNGGPVSGTPEDLAINNSIIYVLGDGGTVYEFNQSNLSYNGNFYDISSNVGCCPHQIENKSGRWFLLDGGTKDEVDVFYSNWTYNGTSFGVSDGNLGMDWNGSKWRLSDDDVVEEYDSSWTQTNSYTLENNFAYDIESNSSYNFHADAGNQNIYAYYQNWTFTDERIYNATNRWFNETYYWKNSSFVGNLGYKSYGRDANGKWNVTNTGSFFVNAVPVQQNSTVTWTGIGGSLTKELTFGYSDENTNDIKNVSMQPSGSLSSTNTTATVSNWNSPFDWSAFVTDFQDVKSGRRDINVTTTDSGYQEDDYSHTLSDQQWNRTVSVENRGDTLTSSTINLADNGTVVSSGSFSGSINNGVNQTVTEVWSGDNITDTEHRFDPQSDPIQLDTNYIGDRNLELQNQRGFQWTDIDTTSITTPNKCSQTNNTAVDLAASATTNYTVEFSCDPGTTHNTGLTTTLDLGSNNVTKRNYSGTAEIFDNETRTVDVEWKIDKNELTDWDNRNNATAYIDGNTTGVTVTDQPNNVIVTFNTSCCTSSPAQGNHSASLVYFIGEDDTTEPGGGGGGGATPDEDTTVRFANTDFTVAPGTNMTDTFAVQNYADEQNTVQITKSNDAECQYVSVQRTLNSDQFGSEGTYQVPSQLATGEFQSFSQVNPQVRISMPENVSESLDDGQITCGFTVSATDGVAEPLNITASPGIPLLQQVRQAVEQGWEGFLEWYRENIGPLVDGTICVRPLDAITGEAECEQSVPRPAPTSLPFIATLLITAYTGNRVRKGEDVIPSG